MSKAASSEVAPPLVEAALQRQRLLIPALHFAVGFSNGLPNVANRMLLVNELQIEPDVQAAVFGVLLSIPWQFKIAMAFLSDAAPIAGRRRIPYLLICISLQAVANLFIGLLAGPALTVGMLASLQFVCVVSQVMIGTICDTLTVENMRSETGKQVGTLQSNCWIMLQLGSLLGLLVGGWGMQYAGLGTREIYLGVAVVKVLTLLCTLPISDPRVSATALAESGCAKVRVLLGQVWEVMKDPIVWKPTVFLFIFAAKPGNADAFNSFLAGKQTNERDPQPLGFSESELAYIGMLGTAANAVGAWLYKKFLRGVALRVLFGTLITIGAAVAASQLILVFGINREWGLPNFWFAIGDDVVVHVVNFMLSMPMLVLMASMCPRGAESTVFALVTSVQTAGATFSGSLSSVATSYFDVTLHDYSRLWQLTLFTASIKLISLPLLPLIPNAIADKPRDQQRVDADADADAAQKRPPTPAADKGEGDASPDDRRGSRFPPTGAVVLTSLLVGGLSWSLGQAVLKLSSPPSAKAAPPPNGAGDPPQHGASAGNPSIPTPTAKHDVASNAVNGSGGDGFHTAAGNASFAAQDVDSGHPFDTANVTRLLGRGKHGVGGVNVTNRSHHHIPSSKHAVALAAMSTRAGRTLLPSKLL